MIFSVKYSLESRNAKTVSCKIPTPINLSPYLQLIYVKEVAIKNL